MTTKTNSKTETPIHPWRRCPYGQHWVRSHELHIPPSNKNPDGSVTIRHEHCAKNPSGKDELYLDEISEIANTHFKDLTGAPNANDLGFTNKGNKYDDLIRGWTKYWNDIFKPIDLLDPDVIKALIASESGFNTNPPPQKTKTSGKARGMIQITDQSRKILRNETHDLKDHFVYLDQKDIADPNATICAGIRWLFEKQRLASHDLGRSASWDEAIAEYKGYLKNIISGKNIHPKGMNVFHENLKKLKGK